MRKKIKKKIKNMLVLVRAVVADVDLDRMTETVLMELIKAAVDRLTPIRLNEVIEAVGEKRRAKKAEVEETFVAEMTTEWVSYGLCPDAAFFCWWKI